MGAGSQFDYNPTETAFGAAEEAKKHIRLALHTDRHQFVVNVASGPAGADIPFVVSAPKLDANKRVPEPGAVPADQWAPPGDLPATLTDSTTFILTGKYRYVEIDTTGAPIGKNVKIYYQPIEPTSK